MFLEKRLYLQQYVPRKTSILTTVRLEKRPYLEPYVFFQTDGRRFRIVRP